MAKRALPRTRRVPTRALTRREIEELWQLYHQFVDCPEESFLRSLNATGEVYLCRDRAGGALVGFEANRVVTVALDGRKNTVIFTSYADLDPSFRGMDVLQRIGLRRFLRLKLRYPFRPLYWMFTASTFTSYLLLPRNFTEYWPHPQRPTPAAARALMNAVMRTVGSPEWDPETGVLTRRGKLRYREGVVADDLSVLEDPDIRFYAAQNPGQATGDSLACLCPLNSRNFLYFLRTMLRRERRVREASRPSHRTD